MSGKQDLIIEADTQFWLCEQGGTFNIPLGAYQGTNGLVFAGDGYAVFLTGIHMGQVTVTVDFRQDEPPLDLDAWEEVVDVSVRFLNGPATFTSPDPSGWLSEPRLPRGSYRLRVHARKRDTAHQAGDSFEEPIEEFLISAWPAPTTPEVRHKLTDGIGQVYRQQ